MSSYIEAKMFRRDAVEKETGMIVIAGACLLVLFLAAAGRRAEMILNFCLRAVMGGIVICGVNMALEEAGFACLVGVNPFTLLASGSLGLSGVSLLYVVSVFRLL